jgi:hypothetical protein
MKMSKSTQTGKSINNTEDTVKENTTLREQEYNKVREELRSKYAPEKKPYYWKDKHDTRN